jgi:hypothetical protein
MLKLWTEEFLQVSKSQILSQEQIENEQNKEIDKEQYDK